jgi:transcriptional regulator with XRE-family HTH domain
LTQTAQPNRKRSTQYDRHVGVRLRLARTSRGMSQSDLGQTLGLTFQQVQKYERGANRISAGRLFEASIILKVEIVYFFEGLDGCTEPIPIEIVDDEAASLFAMIWSIEDSRVRTLILDLISALATGDAKQRNVWRDANERRRDEAPPTTASYWRSVSANSFDCGEPALHCGDAHFQPIR